MDGHRTKGQIMGKTIMGVAAVSLDGFIADDNDGVGPLFDWLGSGDVGWSLPGSDDEARSSRASAASKMGRLKRKGAAFTHEEKLRAERRISI
jgi:hypothetical protein